jgi:hypothetical protein
MPSETPSDDSNFAAKTALPQPPRTNQKVPMNSAVNRCSMVGGVMAVRMARRYCSANGLLPNRFGKEIIVMDAIC